MKQKTVIVKLPRHAILVLTRWRLQHLNNVCKLFKCALCHPSFMPQALSSLVFDHTYICTLHERGLLCTCVHLVNHSPVTGNNDYYICDAKFCDKAFHMQYDTWQCWEALNYTNHHSWMVFASWCLHLVGSFASLLEKEGNRSHTNPPLPIAQRSSRCGRGRAGRDSQDMRAAFGWG